MTRKTLLERFMAKVDVMPCGCWEWTACKDGKGYGGINVGGRLRTAHRVSYELFRGSAEGQQVLHECDRPTCVNPAHLFLGTHDDNMADKTKKGRHAHGEKHGRAKLTDVEVLKIRAANATLQVLADQYGVHPSMIHRIRNGRAWTHL